MSTFLFVVWTTWVASGFVYDQRVLPLKTGCHFEYQSRAFHLWPVHPKRLDIVLCFEYAELKGTP